METNLFAYESSDTLSNDLIMYMHVTLKRDVGRFKAGDKFETVFLQATGFITFHKNDTDISGVTYGITFFVEEETTPH